MEQNVIDVDAAQVLDNPELGTLPESKPSESGRALAKFDPIKARLEALKIAVATTVYDITTAAGMDTACKLRRECVSTRTSADSTYKTLNAPLLVAQRGMRDLVKEIADVVTPLEAKLDAAIKAQEAIKEAERQRKVAAEEARVKALRDKIAAIAALPTSVVLLDAKGISAADHALAELAVDEANFSEFAEEVVGLVAYIRGQLGIMFNAALTREAETERVRVESLRLAEEREKQVQHTLLRGKISDIQNAPLKAFGKSPTIMAVMVCGLPVPTAEEFGDLLEEAMEAFDESILQINAMMEARVLALQAEEAAVLRDQAAAAERQREAEAATARQAAADAQHDARSKELKRQQDAFDAEKLEAKRAQDAKDAALAAERQELQAKFDALQGKAEPVVVAPLFIAVEPRTAAEQEAIQTALTDELLADLVAQSNAPAEVFVLTSASEPVPQHAFLPPRPTDVELVIALSERFEAMDVEVIHWLRSFDADAAFTALGYTTFEEIPS